MSSLYRGCYHDCLTTSMIEGNHETGFQRARVVGKLQGSQIEELGFRKSLEGEQTAEET